MTAVRHFCQLMLVLGWASNSVASEMPYSTSVSSGFRQSARIGYADPPAQALQQALKTGTVSGDAKRLLDELFASNQSKALLVARGDELLYERYSPGVSRRSTPLGYSMSKSLTGLTVGRAICDGHITSIEDPLKKYVPALAGTSWGESSVRHVLQMASGAFPTSMQYNGHKNRDTEQALGGPIAEGTLKTDFIDMMKSADDKRFAPGVQFNYSNFDSIALGLLVQGATGMPFHTYFERSIWASVGAQSRGGWFLNGQGQASTYNGFSATPQDWIRLGLMVLQELKNDGTCFGKYLQELTTKQIASWGPAREYGYQTWVRCGSATDFCFAGFGGQYLLFHVATRTVVYHHATTFSAVVRQTTRLMDNLIPALGAR